MEQGGFSITIDEKNLRIIKFEGEFLFCEDIFVWTIEIGRNVYVNQQNTKGEVKNSRELRLRNQGFRIDLEQIELALRGSGGVLLCSLVL